MNEKPTDITINIAEFLSSLGISYIENVNEESYWQKCWQDIRDAGGDPEKTLSAGDPMSRAVVNMYFMTPEIACKFLAADTPRLLQLIESVEYLNFIPPSATQVAEIGGGPGIISLWLAKKYPGIQFKVFDYAENPLKIGKKWATKLGIKNISFERKSFKKLATEKITDKYDLVMGLSVLDLKINQSENTPHLSITENADYGENKNIELLNEFTKASANLLKKNGLSYFSQGYFNDLGLYNLFNSLRESKLGIDWEMSRARGEGEGSAFSFKEIHIFSRSGLPSVFTSAYEDTQTFLYRGAINSFDKKIILGFSDFETYLDLLSTGVKLSDIEVDRGDQVIERFSIYVKSGMLGFFTSNSSGSRSGYVYSAAAFIASCNQLQSVINTYKSKNIKITKEYWHPFFDRKV